MSTGAIDAERGHRTGDGLDNGEDSSLTKDRDSLQGSQASWTAPDAAAERRLVRKIDRNVLPILGLLYLLSFLDRSNIGNAKLDGLTTDLHISNDNYLWTLTIYFFGYVLFEVPSNIVLKRVPPHIWLPTLMICWGVVGVTMGLVHDFAGLLITRFFLGVTEAGMFPGAVYLMSMWYTRPEQHYRISLFFSAAALSGAFGGVLAYGIGKMAGVGGKAGWSWIFIIESLLTIVVAVLSFFLINDYPTDATFLDEDERRLCLARLKASGDAADIEPFSWVNVANALTDVSVWLYASLFVGMSLPLYTLSLFLPTIIKNLGYSNAAAQLLTVPPYALAFLTTLAAAHFSSVVRRRAPFILAGCGLAAIGYIVLLSSAETGAQYAGVMVAAAGIYPACAIVLSWPANNVSGQTKRAVACALQISIGILGGAVVGSQMYRPAQSPHYRLGHGMAIGWLAIAATGASLQWLLLARRNREKAVAREARAVNRLDHERLAHEKQAGHDSVASVQGDGLGDRSIDWIYQL